MSTPNDKKFIELCKQIDTMSIGEIAEEIWNAEKRADKAEAKVKELEAKIKQMMIINATEGLY